MSNSTFDLTNAICPLYRDDYILGTLDQDDNKHGSKDDVSSVDNSFHRNNVSNNHLVVQPKDETMSKLVSHDICECSLIADKGQPNELGETTCLPINLLFDLQSMVGIAEVPNDTVCSKLESDDQKRCNLLQAIKKKTGNKTQRGVVESIGSPEMLCFFKLQGPQDNALLSNFDIDNTLKQWHYKWPTFFPYNFNMRDFDKNSFKDGRVIYGQPDTLATIKFIDLYDKGYRCCGCVINTDRYEGAGKHWMALFADMRSDEASVEFFNSSGNNLRETDEFYKWMIRTKDQIEFIGEKTGKKGVKLIHASNIRHQRSKTECGVYSLFYIWARLNGVPANYFKTVKVPDQHIFNFRQLLFDDGKLRDKIGRKFAWDHYQAVVKLKWEDKD